MSEDHIGIRVRHWRLKRGLSQRVLAELAGFSQGYIAQIEAGTKPLDKRSSLLALSEALQVAVADLTGQPYDPRTIEHTTAAKALPAVRAALVTLSLESDIASGRPLSQLRGPAATATELHNACRYDRLMPMLPDLLLDLHAAGDTPEALRMLTWVTYATTTAAKSMGYNDLALLAAERCRAAAARLPEAAWRGFAEFAVAHALPAESKQLAVRYVDRAINTLQPAVHMSEVAQVYGMLHLTAALWSAVVGKGDQAYAHLTEAEEAASRTGETNFGQLWFGPTNVAVWRLGILAELGEGGNALAQRRIDPTGLSRSRQAAFYVDLGRSMAQTRRHDRDALAALLRAESIAPQRVRLSPAVRETVGAMLRRARTAAGGKDLQAFAKRLGTV